MNQRKQVLVAVDFSESSKGALDTAAALLGSEAAIDLLHVWDGPVVFAPEMVVGDPDSFLTLAEVADERSRSGMQSFAEAARKRGVRIRGVHRIQGEASGAICQFAKDNGYDLIAMGTHGRSGIQHLLVGSVAEKVLRHAPVPVLTVRTPPPRVA
jgi:nucleotide-binding universal stress UspA family protein